jgi:hypothetical protein
MMTRSLPVLVTFWAMLLAASAFADPPPAQPDATPPPASNDAAPPPAPAAQPVPAPTAPKEGLIDLMGKDVKASGGPDSIGKITDVLIDRSGSVSAVVIDVGGFLGVGSRKIAVDWQLLHVDPADPASPISIAADRASLQSAPAYAVSKEPKDVVQPAETGPAAATAPAPSAASPDKPTPATDASPDNKPSDPTAPDGPK